MTDLEEPLLKRIIQLELDISENCADNCKYLSELIGYLQPKRLVNDSVRLKCLHTVRRVLPIVFETFQVNLFLKETETHSEQSHKQVEKWLKKQAFKLCVLLEELCVSCDEQVADCALLVGTTISAQFNAWQVLFERQIKRVLVSNQVGTERWRNFMANMFSIYGDVALYTLNVICSLQQDNFVVIYRIYELLSEGAKRIPNFISNPNRLEEKVSIGVPCEDNFRKQLRKTFTDAWLFFLSFKLPKQLEFRILEELGSNVIPHITRPLLLVDYLTCFTEQEHGVLSIMALDALFILIRDHGLDYPSFYDKLYSLLTVSNLTTTTQTFLRFMSKLLLTSLNISEHMVMAFVKKLVRLAIRLPPLSCNWCLTCAIHLMRKYPSITCLVHRTTTEKTQPSVACDTNEKLSTCDSFLSKDPFDEFQTECESSNAASSCLWELQLIQSHYLNNIREQFSYFKTDWNIERKTLSSSSIPPQPDDILEMDIKKWLEQTKQRRKMSDYIWQPELPYPSLELFPK